MGRHSNVARVKTAPGPKYANVPEAPTGLTARIEPGVVALDWDAPTNNDIAEIVGYEILRMEVPLDTDWERHVRDTRSTETIHLDDDELRPSTTYVYAVRALTDDERGSVSEHVKIDTPWWGFEEPSEVTGLRAEARDGGVALSWDVHDDQSLDEFLIERVDVESGVGHAIGIQHAHHGWVFVFDDEVESGRTYEYTIKAANHHGGGDESEPVRVTAP